MRLLTTVTAPTTTYTDNGPPLTTLSGNVTLPNGTIPVVDTSSFTWSPNTISFSTLGHRDLHRHDADVVHRLQRRPRAQPIRRDAGLPGPDGVEPADAAPPLATLNVSLVLDQTPADAKQRFTLNDAISLRNSGRF